MKLFTKLALVSSIAISANAMAMQAMDDASLSSTTGQDGINIGIKLGSGGITVDQVFVHDNGGLETTKGGTGVSGAIVIGNGTETGIALTQTDTNANLLDLVIDSDAGSTDKGGAFLNVAASVGGLKAEIGSIGVAASGAQAGVVRGVTGTTNEILTGLTLTLGAIDANIQLGATPQGAMIKLASQMTGGLQIANLGIKDNSATGGGSIHLDNIHVVTTGTDDLGVNADINVTTAGLVIKPAAQDISAYIKGIRLGSSTANPIGDVEIKGLNLGASTITISGH